jgi:hypothetical protein
MNASQALYAIECAIKHIHCATCDKPVDDAEVRRNWPMNQVRIRCHGNVEVRDLEDFGRHDDPRTWFDRNVPRTAFLRNWAGYTIRPERPTGRRL